MTAHQLDHARTGRLVAAGVWVCAAIVMVSSARNGALSFAALGEHPAAGFALGVAVDVALAVALIGDRALHLAGRASAWGRALRITTCAMSGALNCAVPFWQGHYGIAAFHSFLTVLLVLLTEYAQDGTLQFRSIVDEYNAAEHAEREAEKRARDEAAAEQLEAERRDREERKSEREAVAAQHREERDHETRKLAADLAVLQVMTTALAKRRKRSNVPRAAAKRNPARKSAAEPVSAHPLDEPEVPGETAEERRRRLDRNRKRRQAAQQTQEQHEQRPHLAAVRGGGA